MFANGKCLILLLSDQFYVNEPSREVGGVVPFPPFHLPHAIYFYISFSLLTEIVNDAVRTSSISLFSALYFVLVCFAPFRFLFFFPAKTLKISAIFFQIILLDFPSLGFSGGCSIFLSLGYIVHHHHHHPCSVKLLSEDTINTPCRRHSVW